MSEGRHTSVCLLSAYAGLSLFALVDDFLVTVCLTEAESCPLFPTCVAQLDHITWNIPTCQTIFIPPHRFSIHTNQFSHSVDGGSTILRIVEMCDDSQYRKLTKEDNVLHIIFIRVYLIYCFLRFFFCSFIHSFYCPFTSLCFPLLICAVFLFVFENKLIRKIL